MGVRDAFRRGPRPRVAAAMPLQPGWNRTEKRLRQAWQARSEYFATVLGAARFANGISADACARSTLTVEKLEDPRGDVWEPQEDSDLLSDVLRRYKGKTETQRELVRQHAWLEDTVGEAYQLIEDNGRNGLSFSMRSPLSIEWRGSSAVVKDAPGGTLRDGTAREVSNEMIRRVWIPNETWPALATSPMRGVMDDCELYWTVHQKMMRDASSALIGNGILWTPSEAHTELQRSITEPHSSGQPGTDLERDYYAVAQRAFENGDSVEANAPLMMHWSHTYGPPVKIDLAKSLDAQSIAYLTTALEGLARGLNYPQQLLIDGGKDTNHWGVWVLKEDFAKEAIAPKMERIAWGDITATFLRPALRALAARGIFTDDPDLYRVGFDITPIVVHPDQSAQALELYKLGVLADTELLDATGFDVSALPNRAELGRWIMRTQISRETIRAQQAVGDSLPSDAATVIEDTPAAPLAIGPASEAPPTVAALDVPSRVRETVLVGPMVGEEIGWLDA